MGQRRMRSGSGVTVKREQTNPPQTQYSDDVGKECPICHECVGSRSPEGIRETWSMLPCGHHFGSHCIKRYLGISADDEPLCPLCRDRAYHEACGHPVLPFMLTSDGTHPDLVIDDVSGKVRPRNGEDFLELACDYCQDTEEQWRRLAEAGLHPRWKRQVRWLWGRLPFTRERAAEPSASVADQNRHSTDRSRRERIRNQQNGGPWEGPWMDVRSRDPDWEEWWKKQAPYGV
ncbi:uncharacterized protein B0T15DRAFT_490786 [Chaetomium strumarium]|uniref:RING-type domain-containing protein n=1 Tax=Chaetomium strumarium TaxID=1170767 RepID=A0AAJ0M419_9PEZI|nr:hypothetical protein B0T15DRAFT_490786 [Chaetomium strumarium]